MTYTRRNPAGTVLILVVTVLVILALMATAFLAGARNDRLSLTSTGGTGSLTASTLVNDGALQAAETAVVAAIKNTIRNDLFNGGHYRRPWAGFKDYDDFRDDAWLAGRLPIPGTPNTTPVWEVVSNYPSTLATTFGSPFGATNYPNRTTLIPKSLRIDYPAGFAAPSYLDGRTRIFPAFIDPNDAFKLVLAGDADGDGIADSGLFRITTIATDTLSYPNAPAPYNVPHTVSYWGAIRVIDHNSAINVNTAFARDSDFDATGNPLKPNYGFFRSNLGLIELLDGAVSPTPASEVAQLLNFRFGAGTWPALAPVADSGSVRSDFTFATQGDAMENQLARRTINPGRVPGGVGSQSYSAFGRADAAALGYHFGLLDPSASLTDLPYRLNLSVLRYAPNYAVNASNMFPYYPADEQDRWFNWSYNFTASRGGFGAYYYPPGSTPKSGGTLGPGLPLRSLLTVGNPITSMIPAHDMGALPATVKVAAANAKASPDLMPDYTTDWTTASKVNVNVASFGALWGAFWNVMVDTTPTQAPPIAAGEQFKPAMRHGALPGWGSYEQLMVRSALAAVNAIDLRDGDDDATSGTGAITSKKIQFSVGGSPLDIWVYGSEKQAYITEVLIDVDVAAKKYVGVELYNPHGKAINLKNWKLAAVDRSGPTPTFTPIVTFTSGHSVPSNGYFVVHSAVSPPAGITPPPSSPTPLVAANLANAIGQELILLRPRAANGNFTTVSGQYNESSNLYDLVPLDQVDLSGTMPVAGTPARYDYERPTNGVAWQCVYPGTYTTGAAKPTNGLNSVPGGSGSLGSGGAATTSPTYTLQIAADGWAGPSPVAATGNKFPFGGFARNGDMLEIPFIGGYRINDQGNSPAIHEINSVTMDAAFAPHGSAGATQNVGRFDAALLEYAWAADLFDYLTALSTPADDYLPNVNSIAYPGTKPEAVANAAGSANVNENTIPVQGLVNVNTAPWQVLAMLPLVVDRTNGNVMATETEKLAHDIVTDRNANGPFKSLFDLNRVPGFATGPAGNGQIPLNPGQNQGDLSPDNVDDDFETHYLQINRISNLATCRSDAFTVYILVQAWQEDPPNNVRPVLLGERRTAFIVDRSSLNQSPPASTVNAMAVQSVNAD